MCVQLKFSLKEFTSEYTYIYIVYMYIYFKKIVSFRKRYLIYHVISFNETLKLQFQFSLKEIIYMIY